MRTIDVQMAAVEHSRTERKSRQRPAPLLILSALLRTVTSKQGTQSLAGIAITPAFVP